MTIHELANACGAQKIDIPFNLAGVYDHFPPSKSDLLASYVGDLIIGINGETGQFAAQRGSYCILGYADVELKREEIARLRGQF